jgi:hypothetical protein
MSAFVIDTATMHRVIRGLFGRNRWGQLVARFDGEYTMPGERVSADPTAVGRKLFAMNVDAVRQRYPSDTPDELPGPCDGHALPDDYTAPSRGLGRPMTTADMVDAYKAINCLLYQCSEGNVPDSPLYLELERAAGELAGAIVRGMPEYEAAGW